MKNFKLLLLTTTLLLPGALSLSSKNESRPATSFVDRAGVKKAIEYNNAFSVELFNGETANEKPIWSDVNNGSKGGDIVKDEATGVQFKIQGNSTSSFKYNHTDTTAFNYAHSIKVGDKSANNRFIEITIPEGVTAKVKAEVFAKNPRTIFIDSEISNSLSETALLGSLDIPSDDAVHDFESNVLNPGTYYFNFSGSFYLGKFVVELQGLNLVKFNDEDGTLIDSKVVKVGATTIAIKGEDKLGRKFSHWSLTPGGEAFDFTAVINSETTLYAVYKDCKTYTVTFDMNYSGSESIKAVVNENDVVARPDDPKRPGYKFDSWYFNNRPYNFKTLVTSDMTIFAKWSLDSRPVINGPDSLRFGYSKPTDIEAILLQYTASDLEDSNVEIKLERDTYSLSSQELGNYEITLSATDSSGNKVEKTIAVEVYDDLAPVFEAPKTIYKSTSIALTTNDILKEVKATDAIDGEVAVEVISDSYTGFANKAGDYSLNLLASDKTGNRRTFDLDIRVSDSIPDVWYVAEKNINVQSSILLSSQDIIDLLVHTGELKSGYSSIDVTSNYSFKPTEEDVVALDNAVGIYSVVVSARYYSGEEIKLTRSINVYESDEATQQRDNGFVKFCKQCYNLPIKNISNFFIFLYNEFVKLIGHEEWQGTFLEDIEIYE